MALYDNEISDFAQKLVEGGVYSRARWDLFRGQVGLIVWPKPQTDDGLFFPLWEINKPGNVERILSRDFEGVLAQRPGNFDPRTPY